MDVFTACGFFESLLSKTGNVAITPYDRQGKLLASTVESFTSFVSNFHSYGFGVISKEKS